MERKDLEAKGIPNGKIGLGSLGEVVKGLHDFVVKELEANTTWYMEAKKKSRLFARTFRLFAIILGAMGAVLPTIGEIIPKFTEYIKVPASWATVLFAIAGTLLLLDRFFGYSTSWIRFTSTALQLRQALHVFEMEWNIAVMGWSSVGETKEPSIEQAMEMAGKCKDLLVKADGLILDETKAWVQEFERVLQQIEDKTAAATAASTAAVAAAAASVTAPGGVNLTVGSTIGTVVTWKFQIDATAVETGAGSTAAKINLTPNVPHRVKVDGQVEIVHPETKARSMKHCTVETAFTVAPGQVANVPIDLK